MNFDIMRDMAAAFLSQGTRLNWRVHPFGFLRLDLSANLRLHVWHYDLQTKGVSTIHDHAQWDFTSYVLHGAIINRIWDYDTAGLPFMQARIVAGTLEGGLGEVQETSLKLCSMERAEAGESYSQTCKVIHETEALPGTITLVHKKQKDTNTARVFWPKGREWLGAAPHPVSEGMGFAEKLLRQATADLIQYNSGEEK